MPMGNTTDRKARDKVSTLRNIMWGRFHGEFLRKCVSEVYYHILSPRKYLDCDKIAQGTKP